MTEENIYRTALSGDMGEVGLVALRKWEPVDRDPATELADVHALMTQLRQLFLEATCSVRPLPNRGVTVAR